MLSSRTHIAVAPGRVVRRCRQRLASGCMWKAEPSAASGSEIVGLKEEESGDSLVRAVQLDVVNTPSLNT